MEQEFIKALKGKETVKTPIWLMRQAGRYLSEYRETRVQAGGFLDLCYNPELACEVTLQPLRRFDLDAAIIFSDILVVPQALGQKLWFETGEGPRLDPIQSIQDLGEFNPDKFLNFLNPVFEAVDRTRTSLTNDKALIGFSGAPWTLACYMINGRGSRDYQNVRLFARQNPEKFMAILDQLVEAIVIYLSKKIEAGANAIQIFDSWAGVLSVEEFQSYAIEPVQKIVQKLKILHPDIPVIGFPRGAGFNYQSYIDQVDVDGVSCDQSLPLTEMKRLQNSVCVQGNLDNVLLLNGGEEMISQTYKILDNLGSGSFIFNLGHGVIKETNPDHVTQLIETIREWDKNNARYAA